jgi:hypothetical protein
MVIVCVIISYYECVFLGLKLYYYKWTVKSYDIIAVGLAVLI